MEGPRQPQNVGSPRVIGKLRAWGGSGRYEMWGRLGLGLRVMHAFVCCFVWLRGGGLKTIDFLLS